MTARRPPPAAGPRDTPDEVEASLYEALQQGDLERLMALWSDDDEVVCVHPGGPRIVGAAAIRASFEAIFSNGGIPVRTEQVHRIQHIGSALHLLVELITIPGNEPAGEPQTAYVLASNYYVKTALGWRLAAHHASPGMADNVPTQGDAPTTLH